MIDIHCHILPGIDDGASDIYDTLEMASIAHGSGVKGIVATPHCNVPWEEPNYYGSRYRDALLKAREALKEERIPIKLMSGMEVFVTYDLPDLIADGKVLTINHSRYMLIEFYFDEDPEFVEIMIERITEMGIVPIVAHPERYMFMKENPDFVYRLKRRGCLLQANKGSFLGRYGERSERLAFEYAKNGLYTVVASDAHNPRSRSTYMIEARREIEGKCDVKALFETNPSLICTDRPIEK